MKKVAIRFIVEKPIEIDLDEAFLDVPRTNMRLHRPPGSPKRYDAKSFTSQAV